MIMSRCDYCIDAEKGCLHQCKGEQCGHYQQCHRQLHAIIRITMKCTQECHHCCYACSPQETRMMTIATAKKINQFLQRHGIVKINIMGGEFFCNSKWYQIISELSRNMGLIRLTTNGDWAKNMAICNDLIMLCKQFPITIAISQDKYHTNRYVQQAVDFCIQNEIKYELGYNEVDNHDTIIPVKRGYYYAGFMASISKYCNSPCHKYSLFIDEKGYIAKCPVGIWRYDLIDHFLDTSPIEFFSRFKDVASCFRHVISCTDCYHSFLRIGQKFEEGMV